MENRNQTPFSDGINQNEKNTGIRPLLSQYRKEVRAQLIITAVMFILYHIVGVILYLVNAKSAVESGLTEGIMKSGDILPNLLNGADNIIGFGGDNGIITFLAAVILGISGYRWLLDRRSVDFYESQPVSRKSRFFGISLVAVQQFLLFYGTTAAAGFGISILFAGGCTRKFALSVLAQFANSLILFASTYAVAVLAVMLTGTMVVTLLAATVLCLYETAVTVVVRSFFSVFFQTYVSEEGMFRGLLFATPLYNAVQKNWLPVFENLAFGVAIYALAYFAYRKRPNEAAGTAVVFRPVRAIAKIAIAALAGMTAGLLFSESRILGAVIAVLAAFLAGCVMEWIYSFDVHLALKHLPETAAAMGIGVAVTLIFTMDLFGYDRWIPSADSVESAAILTTDVCAGTYLENGEPVDAEEYSSRYMKLTDMKDIREVAGACIDNLQKEDNSGSEVTFLYRMKNGREIKRKYTIPYDVDAGEMDRITGSDEYKEGYYQIYHDTFLTKGNEMLTFDYINGYNGTSAKADYQKFRTAYLRDLKKWDFSYEFDHPLLGLLTITRYTKADSYYSQYPVFEGFDETVSFLKDAGVYVEPLDVEDITSIEITRNSDGGDATYGEMDPEDPSENYGVSYTDPEQIAAIFGHLVNQNMTGPSFWAVPTDDDYIVTIMTRNRGEVTDYVFREGEVPGFVESDLGA